MKSTLVSTCLVAMLAGCSNAGTAQPGPTGGSSVSAGGGHSQFGGSVGLGGSSSPGGATGGNPGVGDAGTGGSPGGTTAAGGGGVGGIAAKGGNTGTGGVGDGGATGSGGTAAKGGASGGVGGAAGKDGGAGTGGSTSVTIAASGYPAAGASGQAQPTGAGSKVTVLPWAGFKGAISLTYDDALQSQIDNYGKLQALNDKGNNARSTFFLITGAGTISSPTWAQALKDGHELANHTQTHAQTASASDIDAAEALLKSKFGVTAYSLAAPYGDASYSPAAVGKFLTNRSAGDTGAIGPNDDPDAVFGSDANKAARKYFLPCLIPAQCASSGAMATPLNNAVSAGKWEVSLVHGFAPRGTNNCAPTDGAYQPMDIADYTAAVSAIKATGNAWIDTVENVSAYWIAGNKFAKLAPTTSGTDKTWNWKTSDFSTPFPPGHYLRVTTDGGTLKQGSTVLQWDDHGYYEVSLDAGTLTLSPSP